MSETSKNSHAPASAGGAATSAGVTFQQKVGAIFGACLLAEKAVDERLNLGNATPVWLRFETNAPVDDILVSTSTHGYLAIQTKTTVSLSTDMARPFGETISQFVRHWLACRGGDGDSEWNRPLDSSRDRLVLAISPQAPKTVREDLTKALRQRSQPGPGVLTVAQQKAMAVFRSCVAQAWESATHDEFDPEFPDQLSGLFRVLVFDVDGAQSTTGEILAKSLSDEREAQAALSVLEILCGQMMKERAGADLGTLRERLMAKGVRLAAAPEYQHDISKLIQHTQSVAHSLRRHERIELADGESTSIVRECQEAVEASTFEESLLIVGEPGSGKSGVVNQLAGRLVIQGKDVLELAAGQHSVESLEGLSRDLGLQHSLLEVLEAWDGSGPAWLIIDALDASRGGRGEEVFHTLIKGVVGRCDRWRVVASIRTFDLRMGSQLRSLFKGTPPDSSYAELQFNSVRHMEIPPWSESELRNLLGQAPTLSRALSNAPPRLRELATIPFNTQLIGDLIADGVDLLELNRVSSQSALLCLYWSRRIEKHGTPAERTLRVIVGEMVEARELRVARQKVWSDDPGMIDVLSQEGMLVRGGNDRWIQFRHHILFDFAAARVLLEPARIVSGEERFGKEQALGLMLAPALGFLLQEVWESQPDRSSFWTAVGHILSDKEGDSIVRSATCRICAELPVEGTDTKWLAERVMAQDENAIGALSYLVGALAIRLEDEQNVPEEPWIQLLEAVAPNVAAVAASVRFLLYQFIDRRSESVPPPKELGVTSRSLLAYGFGLSDPGILVQTSIGFVADTYGSDPQTSRQLLSKVFEDERLQRFAPVEVPSICKKIRVIADADPGFAVEIYGRTYGFDVRENRETQIGSSRILSLTSTARQDYSMSRYALGQFIDEFLERHPSQAIAAIVKALDSYVDRAHSNFAEVNEIAVTAGGRQARLRPDGSHFWAHGPDGRSGEDAGILIAKLLSKLRSSAESSALELGSALIDRASLAVLWSRLFLAAAGRKGGLLDIVRPWAMDEHFLVCPDTRKDAIDVVAEGYAGLSEQERAEFERGAWDFDLSEARDDLLRRLFGRIGAKALVTEEAREVVAETDQDTTANEHLPGITPSFGRAAEDAGMRDGEQQPPGCGALEEAIKEARAALVVDSENPVGLVGEDVYPLLGRIGELLDEEGVTPRLKRDGEDVIVQACSLLLERGLVPSTTDSDGTDCFLHLLRIAAGSASPEVAADTEERFEESASWGVPAPRVDAARVLLQLLEERPDLLGRVSGDVDSMLKDPHPAVRLGAGLHLRGIGAEEGFWRRVEERSLQESNVNVLAHLVSGLLRPVLHGSPVRAEGILLELVRRYAMDDGSRVHHLRSVVGSQLGALWVEYSLEGAQAVVRRWAREPAKYHEELREILRAVGPRVVRGAQTQGHTAEDGRRGRALALTAEIVGAVDHGLTVYYGKENPDETDQHDAKVMAQVLDQACLTLYFSCGAGGDDGDDGESREALGGIDLDLFLRETAPILRTIGNCATPHTAYYLLQLLEALVAYDPEQVFDLCAHVLRRGGRQTGFQFEAQGADLIVRLVGGFLADHREIFQCEARRAALIECIEIFMEAGWPSAHRLLYRLPELIQ